MYCSYFMKMAPKKKLVVDDSDYSDDDAETSTTKAVAKKRAPKKASPKKTKVGQVAATNHADEAEEPAVPQGYSGIYEHTADMLLKVDIPERPKPIMCADGSGARLMIKEILVTNFKSYYGTQRIGPFHKNFSAIIGPNGSGKSNVIDSLLFVFGFRASRIRLKKLKELIHNSSGKDRPQFCSVEVAFQKILDNPDGTYTVIENSEFRIGRTAFQDSTSKYTINGKTHTNKEIEAKLKSVGIDLVHNRFLILQGEVEQIALMKCKAEGANKEGMLEYLEDIIGSSRLNPFINDIALKIDEINTEKSQQNQRVKAAENERNALEGPVREMISHLRCENQAMLISNKLLTIKKFKYEKDLATQIPERDRVKDELESAQIKLDEMQNRKKEIEKEFLFLENEKEKVQSQLAKTQKTIMDVEAKETGRKNDNKRCVKDLKSYGDKLKNAQQELDELLQVPERSKKLIQMKEGEIQELQEEVKENEKKYEKNKKLYDEKVEPLRAAVREAEAIKSTKTLEFDNIDSRRRLLDSNINGILSKSEGHKKRLEDLQQQRSDAQQTLDQKQKEISEIKNRLPGCTQACDEASNLGKRLNEQYAKTVKERNALTQTRDELAAVASVAQEEDKSGIFTVMRALLKAQEEGKLTFYGRLGDLGTVDDKYQRAISNSTSGLNNFVVQSKKDGDVALDIIKKLRCGRHGLMVLDSVAVQRAMDNPPNLPADRIFDKVQVSKDEFRKAFYYIFQNSMIVDKMEDARKFFNSHRARYITMEGGVMDASGTLSGGGTKMKPPQLGPQFSQSDNAAQSKDAKEARVKLEKVDGELKKQIELTRDLNEKIAENERKYQQLSDEKERLEEGRRRLTNDTNNLNSRIVSLERSINELKKVETTLDVDNNELERLRGELEAIIAAQDVAQKELNEANEAYQKADAAANRVFTELLGRFGDAVKTAEQKITIAKNDINTESMKLNTFEKDRKKIASKVDGAKIMIENKEKELKRLENEETVNEEALNQLRTKKQEYETAISEMENKIKEARKNTSTQDEEENITIKLIDKLTDEYKTLSESVKALEHSNEKIKKEISSLKLHRIKEYGILPEKIKKPAQHDHIIDEETLAEEKAHQKKMKRRKAEDMDEDADNSDGDDGSLPVLGEEDVKDCNRDELKFKLQQLQEKVRKNKEQLNMRIIEEYTEKTKKYTAEHTVLVTMQDNHKKHMARMEEWKRVRLQEFMEGFTEIGKNLKEMYQMITLGGDASLDLKDSLDPFSEGIQFMVRPPKKSWKNIENLSGGEKTLSSLSLVFALHKYRPTPLYVMDEIDAALDFRNVSIIGHYVKEKTKNAQFIIISLRNNMFELGDRLVGIYKTFDCTKNVIVDPAEVMKQSLPVRNALQTIHNVEQDVGNFDFTRIQVSPEKNRIAAVRSSMEDLDLANGTRKRHSFEDATVPKRPDLRKSPVAEKPRASRAPSSQPL